MSLKEYINKRHFNNTPEPSGDDGEGSLYRFVVQRHQASHLHYDLRLEMDGVLKSWAIPKGPSMNPADKRLAIRTEDHPVKYLTFEGKIPKGNYGAGVMQIWDSGIFQLTNANEKDSMTELVEKGDLKITFEGTKLKGNFALVETRREGKEQWLLIKKKDKYATELDYDAERFADSTKNHTPTKNLNTNSFNKPMLASSTKAIFDDTEWVYELKWDGYRIISHIDHGKVSLYSRNGISYTEKFQSIANELAQIPHKVILDGEVVAVDEKGIPDFQALQHFDSTGSKKMLMYYVFDVLHLNEMDTISLPLLDRKSLLPDILADLRSIVYCDHIVGMGTAFYNLAISKGMEGVIAKKADSTYEPGYRSDRWLKIKSIESREALICGYTDSDKGGMLFGSLILGAYEEGQLVYLGNCGSGFSGAEQRRLIKKFEKVEIENSPFAQKIALKGRKPNWLQPLLICEVKFSEQTKRGILRHPSYKGLREDKTQQEISIPNKIATQSSKPINTDGTLEVEGFHVPISNLDKLYWPDEGYNKYDLINYYLSLGEYMIPYLKDRPQNLNRYPHGIKGESFYQKDNENLPAWIETYSIYSESSAKNIEYLLCQNEATLLYMANLGCIEINPWNSTIHNLDYPDYTVIDLDPSSENTFEEVIEVALVAKEVLDLAKIKGFCKTSGSSGIHIYIPLEAQYAYDQARDFTKLLCYYIMEKTEGLTSMDRAVKNRKGKIYLDYLQNRRGQTLATAYCVRPKPGATVSAPIKWEELKKGLAISDFTIKNMPLRIENMGDLFAPVLGKGIDMEKAIEFLEN